MFGIMDLQKVQEALLDKIKLPDIRDPLARNVVVFAIATEDVAVWSWPAAIEIGSASNSRQTYLAAIENNELSHKQLGQTRKTDLHYHMDHTRTRRSK